MIQDRPPSTVKALPKLLIVEDDHALGEALCAGLRQLSH